MRGIKLILTLPNLILTFKLMGQVTCIGCTDAQYDIAYWLGRSLHKSESMLWRYPDENLNYEFKIEERQSFLWFKYYLHPRYTPFSLMALNSSNYSDSALQNVISRTDFTGARNLQALQLLSFNEKSRSELKRLAALLPEFANKYLFIFSLYDGNVDLIEFLSKKGYQNKSYDIPCFQRDEFFSRKADPQEPEEGFVSLRDRIAGDSLGTDLLTYYFRNLPEVDYSFAAKNFHYLLDCFSSDRNEFPIPLPESDSSGLNSFFQLYVHFNAERAKSTLFQNALFCEEFSIAKNYFAQGYRKIYEYTVDGSRLDTTIRLKRDVVYLQTDRDTLYACLASRVAGVDRVNILKTDRLTPDQFRTSTHSGQLFLQCYDDLKIVDASNGFKIKTSIAAPRGLRVIDDVHRITFLAFEQSRTTLYHEGINIDAIPEDLSSIIWLGRAGLRRNSDHNYSYFWISDLNIFRWDINKKVRFLTPNLLEFQEEQSTKKGVLTVTKEGSKVIVPAKYDEVQVLKIGDEEFLEVIRKGKTYVYSKKGIKSRITGE